MAAKTPEERALADVEKGIKNHTTAHDKAQAAQQKADAARAAEKRALRELEWYARHPDLADDFDLDAFRASLEAPFDEGGVLEPGASEVVNDTGEDEQVVVDDEDPEAPEPESAVVAEFDAADEEDDPWAESA